VVRFDVNAAAPDDKVYVELFDAAAPGRTRVTPVTATNFLKYVDAGHYANTMVHRAVSGFVVQGGGFNVSASGALQLGTVTNLGTIVNEPGPVGSTNVRGTIAMAKVAGNPNSGSNQWFFNLADNTNPADENSLDRQNGGFTTFGRVLGSGMTAVDTIGNLPTFDLLGEGPNSVFAATPLRGIPNPVPPNFSLQRPNFVLFPAITRVGELVYSVTTDNPALVTPTIVNGSLNLAFASGGVGTATVSVRAQSVFDATDFKVDSFVIDRRLPFTPGATLVGNVEFGALPAGYALRVGPGNGQVIMVTTGGVNASATNPGAGWVAVGAERRRLRGLLATAAGQGVCGVDAGRDRGADGRPWADAPGDARDRIADGPRRHWRRLDRRAAAAVHGAADRGGGGVRHRHRRLRVAGRGCDRAGDSGDLRRRERLGHEPGGGLGGRGGSAERQRLRGVVAECPGRSVCGVDAERRRRADGAPWAGVGGRPRGRESSQLRHHR
jgi:cyclophilin family peptidyl-prolyl cis-trans isomerase